jgi:hypothetical protein
VVLGSRSSDSFEVEEERRFGEVFGFGLRLRLGRPSGGEFELRFGKIGSVERLGCRVMRQARVWGECEKFSVWWREFRRSWDRGTVALFGRGLDDRWQCGATWVSCFEASSRLGRVQEILRLVESSVEVWDRGTVALFGRGWDDQSAFGGN